MPALPTLSIELFPPKDQAGEERMWQAVESINNFDLATISVTYGAGGSSRDRTIRIAKELHDKTNLPVTAHLTCVSSTREELESVVDDYSKAGIKSILALRGDPVGGPTVPWTSTPNGLDTAEELVKLLAERNISRIGVAAFPDGHPASNNNLKQDLDVLLKKEAAGATFAVTQFFFNLDNFYRLRDQLIAAGSKLMLIPGILPISNLKQLDRMAVLGGAELPESVLNRFAEDMSQEEVTQVGIEIATELCHSLIANEASGLHFYTMNTSHATATIARELGYKKK